MEGRCVVETWADFGFSGTPCAAKLGFAAGTEVFVCPGRDEIYVFSAKERKLTVVLQLPGPVSDLLQSHDEQLLYAACRSGVYCVSLQLILSRARGSPADESSGPVELKISSEHLVVPEGALSLLLVGPRLLTLSRRDMSWVLTLYNCPKQSASGSCETLASFSLPVVSGFMDEDTEGRTRTPVLVCVHCGDASETSSSTSSSETTVTHGNLHLQSILFKLLFGIDAAFAKSPVVLCGLPDGRLCFLPLRLPESRLRVLHSLEQPLVFIGAETRPGPAECLVAVGEQGRLVLIKMDNGSPEGGGGAAAFIERCVPGPVMCGCMDKSCLYYSTGSDLLRLDLSGGEGREGEEGASKSRKTAAALQSPASLNVCRVVALAEPTSNATGEVQLLGLSARGQLQRITLPVGKYDSKWPMLPSVKVDRTFGDVLAAIGNVCERASMLKSAIKSKKQILMHLNQVLNISFLLIDSPTDEERLRVPEKPIRCRAKARWSRLLQRDELSLTCVLDNSSPYVLERGWTLSVAVFPLSYPLNAGGDGSSAHFSFPFHNLHPGETLEVSLPLAPGGGASFPVTACCSLVLSLSALLGEEEAAAAAANLPGLRSSSITLPVNTLTVDWLHALQAIGPADTQRKDRAHFGAATDSVQVFLSSRHIRRGRGGAGGRGGATKPDGAQCSARIRVPFELLRRSPVLKSSGPDPQGSKVALDNVCGSLLEWLLSDGPGGTRAACRGDGSSVVHARGPDSHPVTLTAREVKVGAESVGEEEEEEESLATVEVQVQSSSIAAVCGLHHAVLRRVQALLLMAPGWAASTQKVQSLGLRRALQRAEDMLQQIQQSRVSEAFGAGVAAGQMNPSLLSIYRELRENPVILM
ncbi:Fanconi anemia core complex-associated protein 100 [Brachionichthys hirsutus]|uniref:Fanconi anemia core complex-associated protein 100 n=1 Tax=Brachionichthys hirsutus TaxID=412623 RepID=UPI0036047AB1